MTSTPSRPPGPATFRVVDGVAVSDSHGLRSATGRIGEFPLDEALRIIEAHGEVTFHALLRYLRAMRAESAADGRTVLVVDDFSGRWLIDQGMGRTAAYTAQRELEASGILTPIVSRRGQGARGKQRGAFNTNLVLVPGGADGDISELRRKLSTPGSRGPATREHGPSSSGYPISATREPGPESQVPDLTQPGKVEPLQGPEHAAVPDRRTPGTGRSTTGSSGGVFKLLSDQNGPGALAALAAQLRAGTGGRSSLRAVFNRATVGDRAAGLLEALGYTGFATGIADFLTEFVAGVLTGELDPVEQMRRAGVRGEPWGQMPNDMLAERLVAGVIIGLGMKQVTAWGGWLYKVAQPAWVPTSNSLLTALLADLRASAGESPARLELTAAAEAHGGRLAAGAAADENDEQAADRAGEMLPEEIVERFREQAIEERGRFLPASKLNDDRFIRVLVAGYLEEHPELLDAG